MHFAGNLRTIRKERGLSQEDLAELLHVSRQAVSKWEQGLGYPEMENIITLAKALDVSLDYLIAGKTDHAKPQQHKPASTGRIMIKTQDGKQIVSCYKVSATCIPLSSANEPKCVLSGVYGTSFLGDDSVILGWYADECSIQQEIDSILAAMERGEASYELKYIAKVKTRFFSVKLDKE